MSTTPTRPGTEPEVTEEDKKIILERRATLEEDKKSAVDSSEVIARARRNLKHPSPR